MITNTHLCAHDYHFPYILQLATPETSPTHYKVYQTMLKQGLSNVYVNISYAYVQLRMAKYPHTAVVALTDNTLFGFDSHGNWVVVSAARWPRSRTTQECFRQLLFTVIIAIANNKEVCSRAKYVS